MFNTWKPIIAIAVISIHFTSCSNKIIPDKPFLSKTSFKMDSLPESEVSIPIQVNMKPLYQLAEKLSKPEYAEDAGSE